ncbi:protein sidekick-like isoform X3 [Penaeus chinensis]|uniref:protein sidekick-like isoform X3 n=1 Tax=Penaeus chinensis TaxID=139456 RepID=UPI001FB7C8AA|nr:protein sidekick-like isoform X3 [Penaeus chinensis]
MCTWARGASKMTGIRRSCWSARWAAVLLLLLLVDLPSSYSQGRIQAPRYIGQQVATESVVSEGHTKILQCQALGYPQPEYRWLRDGSPLGEFSGEHFYKISSVTRDDAGDYRCVARNSAGSIFSAKITVVVAYMNGYNETESTEMRVRVGDAAILSLPPLESYPPPSVTWQADDSSLLYGIKYATTDPANELIILEAQASDMKTYSARITNTQLGVEEVSGGITLVVEGSSGGAEDEISPSIIVPPANTTIVKDSSIAHLQCIANARPLYQLETLWFKDDVPIEQSGVVFSFNGLWNRTLSLLQADLHYAGVYKCQVRLRTSIDSPIVAEANVIIHERPKLKQQLPVDTYADLGKTLTIPCSVTGTPIPYVTWYRNAANINTLDDNRYRVLLNGSLAISSVQVNDTGMFQCLASNEAGEASAYTWLKVKTWWGDLPPKRVLRSLNARAIARYPSAPVMLVEPQNMTVLDGQDATMTCRAGGAPTPNITWFFNDNDELFENGHYEILASGDLLIVGVRTSDEGKYTCMRANEAGSVSGDAWLSILVKTHIIQPPVDTRVILGRVASLQCKVSHAPSVSVDIHWYHEKNHIDPNGTPRISIRQDGTLEIQEARAADVGQYTCMVRSSGGNETRSARLEVIELPYAPTSVKAERAPRIPKSVRVSWTPTFDGNSPIIKFIIQKREVPVEGVVDDLGLNWVTVLTNVSAATNEAIVSDLRPSTGYQFRVSAVNNVGEGSPSQPSNTVILPQEAPSGPPQGLVGSPRSSTEIMIQWEAPMEEERNGMIHGYMVRYRLWGYKDSQWYYRNITKETQHNYLIGGLIIWKDYEIQVAAYNVKGVGVYSHGIRVKTKEGVPAAPPKDVKVEALSATAIKVMWKPPDPWMINGINQGYKLQAWKVQPEDGAEPDKTTTVPPSPYPDAVESAQLVNLDKYTEYYITVLCFTHPGDGNRSQPIKIRTLEDVPDTIESLKFEDISDRSVRVIWSEPEQSNGILKGYTLTYMVKDTPSTKVVQNFTADVTTHLITDLSATTFYTFEVYGWTTVGPGTPVTATIQSGVEPVLPDPPNRLAVSNIQAFSVVLQFTPGFDGNASISKWTVQAQSSRSSTWETVYSVSAPDATTITVQNLIPYTNYHLRLIANNVVGASAPSEQSPEFQTLQAEPAHPPSNMTVRAMSSTQLRVRWIPLQQFEWYGAPQGYHIRYRPVDCECNFAEDFVYDNTANSHQLVGLQEYTLYEVSMVAVNDIGPSTPTPLAVERTRESVPSAGPDGVSANATTSTTIVVRWKEVPKIHQNGIIEGYKVVYVGKNMKPQEKIIPNNNTFAATITQLRKYYQYTIQVLAYTRKGDGALSTPPLLVQTHDDVPGPPSDISFPDVTFTSARIIWDEPKEPNGEITAYSIVYHLADSTDVNNTLEFGHTERTYKAIGLKPQSYYMFLVRARTRLGLGRAVRAPVYTTNNREFPAPPSRPSVSHSQITSTSITFSWNPGRDGFAPIRYYTVQYTEGNNGWQTIEERIDYSATSYTAPNLKPFTPYTFRLQATNDIGPSGWSDSSIEVRTLPAAPTEHPTDIKVIPITTNSVRVEWTPLFPDSWSGDAKTGGYRVKYRKISDIPTAFNMQHEELQNTLAREVVLQDLQRDMNYEVLVVAFNSQGESPPSAPITVYVGEAVPTGKPKNVNAEPVTSTEIKVTWEPPEEQEQNGELLGYKIFFRSEKDPEGTEEIEVVGAGTTSYELLYLDMYTRYIITILCFNPAGDGPKSDPVYVRTLQDLPGPVANLSFTDITMNSLKVVWDSPARPNGEIVGYLVTYVTARPDENFSKQVKQKVGTPYLLVTSLEEEVTYEFNVKAQTIDYGPEVKANVTTGPQPGSPARPKDLTLTKTVSSVTLHWRNSHSGKGSILGYYIEAKKIDSDKWSVLMKTETGEVEEYTVSYQNLLPSTQYEFRLIAYNKYGISYPAVANEKIVTPSKRFLEYGYLQQRPFYHQTWFMVTLAAISVVLIIIVIAALCVKSKTYKYKRIVEELLSAQEAANKTMEESLNTDETAFSTFEMRQSRRGTMSKRSTLGRRSVVGATAVVNAKSPPRPAPASVTYSDDDTVKGYDENPDDSSELTEKPTDLSSTASEQESESENESHHSEPHSFVNHYANVNDTLRQSWRRQKPVRNYSSYTDSEAEGSAVMSLNGGQIIMNNMAGSRAPLPGFSSFV